MSHPAAQRDLQHLQPFSSNNTRLVSAAAAAAAACAGADADAFSPPASAAPRSKSAVSPPAAAPTPPANASITTVVFASLALYFPNGFAAVIAAAPQDAVHAITTPCWAGAGPGGGAVSPPGMGCAPAVPPPTQGAPPPYAFGYAVLDLSSQTGGHVSLVLRGL